MYIIYFKGAESLIHDYRFIEGLCVNKDIHKLPVSVKFSIISNNEDSYINHCDVTGTQ